MKTFSFLFILTFFTDVLFCQNILDNAGLTSGSPAAVAFSLRKLTNAYTGPVLKVRRSSDNSEATLAFNGSGGVSGSSVISFTPGAIVGTSLGVLQAGTISSDAGKTGLITIKANKTGSLTTTSGSLIVTGTGTSFTTELVAGDRLFNAVNNVFTGVIASIANNTTLSLNSYATITGNLITYKSTTATVTGAGTNFTGELTSGDRLFNSANGYLGTVASIMNATTLMLHAVDAVSVSAIGYKGTTATITGSGTNFTGLSAGDLLISNNITLGIIASIVNSTSLTLTAKAGGSVSALAFKSGPGSLTFSAFYASTSVFINTWYDQSGNNRDAIQLKPGNQARLVNAGVLYSTGGKASVEFSSSLASFLQTSAVTSYINNIPYTLNKVSAEATTNPSNQFPLTTTGGGGPTNTVLHFGYRSSSWLTLAQLSHDHNFNANAGIALESHTAVKLSAAASQMYKNGVFLGTVSNGAASYLLTAGLINIGCYIPTNVYYNGSVSEIIVFPSALSVTDANLLNNNQLLYYNIGTVNWTGAVSSDWNTTGNWSSGVVPTLSDPSIALIPAGKPNYPVIDLTTVQANSISIDAGASLIVSGDGVLQLAGTINNLGTCNVSAGTVEYIGSAPQGIAANTYTGNVLNLIVNNSSGVTLNGNLTVSGNLTFTSGKLAIYISVLTIGGTVTNTVSGGLRGEPNSALIVNGSVSPTLSFDQTTPGGTNILKNLTINSMGQTITLANALVMLGTGTTTFTAGKLAIGNATLTIRGAVLNTVNEGLKGSLSGKLVADGTSGATLSFDQTIPGITNALKSLLLNCSGQTITLNRNLVIDSLLGLTSGTLSDGGNQIISAGILNLVSGTLKLGSPSVATSWPGFTVHNISPGGTAEYAAGVPQTVSGVPSYQNLTISAAGGATAASDLTVNGILHLSAANPSAVSGSLSMSTYTLNMGGSAITSGQGDVTGIVKRTTVLPNINYTMGNEFTYVTFPNTGTLPSQMSMKINIGTVPSWRPGAINRTYEFIQTGGVGTKAVIVAHYLDAELNGNVENKLVDFSYRFSGTVLTEHGKSNFNTTQNWVALSNVNIAFFPSSFGQVELSLDESTLTTLTWNGSTSTSWITATNWTPNGGPSTNTALIIPDASTTPNDPFIPATASNGSLSIEAGGVVNADPLAQLTLNNSGLTWSNSGTFNASSSNIVFTNTEANVNGVTNFNNVTINSGANVLLTSGAVMRIAGAITNNGIWSTGLLENTVEYNGNNQTVVIPNGSTQSYYNLIISGTGTSILPPASVNILGDLTVNGAVTTTGNTIAMNGLGVQAINGITPIALNNLIINYSTSRVSMNQDLTIGGTLTILQGKLAIGSHTLTLSGNVINTALNGITGSNTSNLILNGAVSPVLSFDISEPGLSNSLNNFTINSSGQAPQLGSDLEVEGIMLFSAGKLALNGNTLTLNGAVTNTVNGGIRGGSTSSLVVGGGVVSPVISFDQSTAGTTNLLNNFTINSAGQTASLANPLMVSGALGLSDGLLVTNGSASLTLTSAAAITGGSAASFVSGPLVRNTNSVSPYHFPVGKMNDYDPLIITPVSSAAGSYNTEFFPVQGPAGTNAAGLSAIANDEYWVVDKISGPDATLTLLYTHDHTWSSGSPTSMDDIFVAQNTGGIWNPENGTTIPGNTVGGITPVTSKGLSSFSYFTFGFSAGTVLPATLVSITAKEETGSVQILWTTAAEYSLVGFEVQRSADGRNFSSIGAVAATNTPRVKSYVWVDKNPLEATAFYRLKMTDTDGTVKYSAVVTAGANGGKSITVYPNPVTGKQIAIQMNGQMKGDYIIRVFNAYGDKVSDNRILHSGVNGIIHVGLGKTMPAGIFYLEINAPDNSTKTIRILVN